MNLLHAMLSTVLPVFLMASLGWVLRRYLNLDVKEPAKICVYLLTPGLILNSILTSKMMAAEVGKVIAYAFLLTIALIAVTQLLGKLLGWSQTTRSAAVLSTSFMNAANYGLPIILLAFGQAGFERAAVFIVLESLFMYSIAVFFAARGRMDWRSAVAAVFKLPLVWAAIGGLAVRLTGIPLPEFITKPISLFGGAAPVVLVVLLGAQVAGIQMKGALVKIGSATVIRLLASPLIGLALVAFLHPEPLTAKVLVLEAAMPASVNVTLLAVQFDAEPDQVSGATLLTTLLSLVTVSFWVWYLQNYFA